MNCDIHCSAIPKIDSCLKQTITLYNTALGTIRKITNAPCLPLSRKIHRYLSPLMTSMTTGANKDEDYFRNDIYPYQDHLYIAIAVKIMQRREIQTLLGQLYT